MVALAKNTQPNIWTDTPVQVQYGDVWQLGRHRLLCGDATSGSDVAMLMQGEQAVLCHADPPYGMGKEKQGVINDNLYGKKLDAFQMAWWNVARPHLANNASAYIWGNAEDLWRLWYAGGLKDSERLTFRNEIVWRKGSAGAGGISHIGAKGLRLYPQETERCLFFMLGEQEMSTNADNYWDSWTPLVTYLDEQRKLAGWAIKDTKRIAGHSENSGCHWFDKSQWMMPTRETYNAWRQAAQGQAFKREYDDLKREYLSLRAYFDNTHENMTDVWNYPRVTGKHRYGHPTPKPTAMIGRILKTSSSPDALVYEPFLGSGTTLIAGENTDRRVYGCEISPHWCEVTIDRWQQHTGQTATRISLLEQLREVK